MTEHSYIELEGLYRPKNGDFPNGSWTEYDQGRIRVLSWASYRNGDYSGWLSVWVEEERRGRLRPRQVALLVKDLNAGWRKIPQEEWSKYTPDRHKRRANAVVRNQ
jgi:hypothetical protein